jgi:hypothetical protein
LAFGVKYIKRMIHKIYLVAILLCIKTITKAQILGGGTNFSNAVIFNNNWLTNCPSGAQTLSNTVAFEPTIPLDACAPAPSTACVPAGSTMASDVWFSFYATKTTAKIVVAPTSAFNIVLQAFSGSACPGLTDIGCANLLGNNGTETLDLTGLVLNQLYYFRILGVGNNAGTRTGQYTFCGTTDLGSSITLPINFTSFNVIEQNATAYLSWSTTTDNTHYTFEIEKSVSGNQFYTIGNVSNNITNINSANYTYVDKDITNENIYYRIKQIDAQGKFNYSAIAYLKIKNAKANSVAIFPNPVLDKITTKFISNNSGAGSIRIFNIYGELVQTLNIHITKGENIISFNKSYKLEEGAYTLQIITASSNFNTRFIAIN